ncbi:FAD-dependent oxidoreductase [Streptomyces sp. P9(2023)]|uniref:NAD(P)/FAD-dependent oxidoreductase n=1 Tax=Streptomyces sp. P9(2023) TaxID=3064394 RepID=UPI0028F3EE39|nr:FAD-dependent oxidoreductase [Streptomyces sp. P9(2023)]MDT9692578.1 FAD-dependent oxidoreductase [Streptomyces sp. P9(2023)]
MDFDVVVVGGGAAGVDAAAEVRRRAPEASVALISPERDLHYRPWLVYLPAAAVPETDLSIPLSGIASTHGFQHIQDSVHEVRPKAGEVTLSTDGRRVTYHRLILAPGAPADRDRIPGAAEHALYPCDRGDAGELVRRLREPTTGTVVFLLTGERIGPGLEYAGWSARAARDAGRGSVKVVVVEDGDAMDRQFGVQAADRLVSTAGTLGIETVRHARVERVESGKLVLASGAIGADIVCVTSPLRGPDLGLPAELLDARGMLKVDATLAVPQYAGIFSAGDFADVQGLGLELPKTWMMARLQAVTAARNAVVSLSGGRPAALDARKAARMAAISMPDVGGRTVFVRNRKPVLAGSWPLRMRYRVDAKYLSRYRTRPGATRPAP